MNKRGFMLIKLLVIVAVIAIVAAEALGDGLNCQREVWVAIRDDGKPGSGTVTDPFNGGTVEKLNGLFSKFVSEYGDNITMHFGPGVFYGDRPWWPRNNWKIRGAGMDITVFKTQPNPNRIETVGFLSRGYDEVLSGFEISDVTFDFNVSNLRSPNRAFVTDAGKVTYVYVDVTSEWSAKKEYGHGQIIQFRDSEFIALKASRGKLPVQGEFWSVLRSTQPADLPVWDASGSYSLGEAAAKGERVYLCVESGPQNSDPSLDAAHWQVVDSNAIDPAVYTRAVFIHGQPPSGGHRATRVKVINGNGSRFFRREAFLIALGGNDCVIEDCIVEQFRGDYATLIIVPYGQNSVVRGCVVRGNDESSPYAYGGWACWNTIFENNFCSNVDLATNIDSLTSRNVTFRGNTFLDCRKFGIHVNVNGRIIESCRRYSMTIDGKTVTDADFARSCMDGLYIYDNYIQIRDDAHGGAIDVQKMRGVSNVVIRGNTLRTTSGSGRARAIVALYGKNAIVYDNLCETNMYCRIIPQAFNWYNNVNLLGQPMKSSQGQPITGRPSKKR